MATAPTPAIPAWQTEELQDEWIDVEEPSDGDNNITYGARSVSLTEPLATYIRTNSETSLSLEKSSSAPTAIGTFLVRDGILNSPKLLPKTPGHQKGMMKNFFSQMPLERMFEPPSPPSAPSSIMPASSQLSRLPTVEEDEIIETDIPNMVSFHGRRASLACQFTFAVPKESFLNPAHGSAFPQAQSTPNPPPNRDRMVLPTPDSRLRLFQFQYDTYTREHLSAMVDSIAVNSGSGTGTTPSPTVSSHVLSRVSEVTDTAPYLRSAKRVKLSPRADFYGEGAGEGASIARPKVFKDYVGESRCLMQQIKQARDFSTISTVASNREHSPPPQDRKSLSQKSSHEHRSSILCVPSTGDVGPKSGTSSSSNSYREQAVTLMAQIRQDMKGHKRILSEDTVSSHCTTRVVHPDVSRISQRGVPQLSPERTKQKSPRRASSSAKPSPPRHRFSLRRSSSSQTGDQQLSDELLKLSIQERRSVSDGSTRPSQSPRRPPSSTGSHLGVTLPLNQPSYPSSSVRGDDLNRFVSSSTASGTTLTAGSAPSFVKHAGPTHIRTIAPTDLPELPDKLGDMLFDKVMMRWVKNTARVIEGAPTVPDEPSEDPFGDIESLRDEPKSLHSEHTVDEVPCREMSEIHLSPAEMSRIDEQSEVDEEEMGMTSFLTDSPSALIVDVMTGVETVDDETTDSDSDDDQGPTISEEFKGYDSDEPLEQSMSKLHADDMLEIEEPPGVAATPLRPQASTAATPIRSALKSRSATPAPALKDPSKSKCHTPRSKREHRRSVSFSDGRRDGPIQGLGDCINEDMLLASASTGASAGGFAPSARSRRIAQMMEALEDTELDESPSKSSSADRSNIQALSSRKNGAVHLSESGRRIFSRSRTQRISFTEDGQNGNLTFLTECSFTVAHDRLVEVITDVQPFVPHWEDLNSIDLSGKKLESVARLKEFLPRLDALNLNSNQLPWLSGVPSTVRTLSVALNSLTRLASYSHLLNLENLDISQNDIDSLSQLACLRHLRELKADGNKVTSIEGLQNLGGLVKLSLQGNSIRTVDLSQHQWDMLNMSRNRLENIRGLASLEALVALNLDNNEVGTLEVDGYMLKLRILRVSGNRLGQLHVGNIPNLRTLYADNNALSTVTKLERLTKLENLSLRNQSGRGLNLLTRDVRDVKRLYLSGNPLPGGFLSEPCYNLLYLELAACRLTALPEDLSRVVPNLRVLNLNYNFLEDARPLEGLTRLKKLTIIGSRLRGTKPLIRILQRMPEVEMVDFRMNPCTLGWYLPLLVRDLPGALQPSEGRSEGAVRWQEMDSQFRRDLPDEAYIGRLAYRGLIMRACAGVRMVDGVEVGEKERAKAQRLLGGMLGRGKGQVDTTIKP